MFDVKYSILHDFRKSALFKEKLSDHFKDLHKLKLLTNLDVNLTSFLFWSSINRRKLPEE